MMTEPESQRMFVADERQEREEREKREEARIAACVRSKSLHQWARFWGDDPQENRMRSDFNFYWRGCEGLVIDYPGFFSHLITMGESQNAEKLMKWVTKSDEDEEERIRRPWLYPNNMDQLNRSLEHMRHLRSVRDAAVSKRLAPKCEQWLRDYDEAVARLNKHLRALEEQKKKEKAEREARQAQEKAKAEEEQRRRAQEALRRREKRRARRQKIWRKARSLFWPLRPRRAARQLVEKVSVDIMP